MADQEPALDELLKVTRSNCQARSIKVEENNILVILMDLSAYLLVEIVRELNVKTV